jgi:hypothetical protein
VKIPTECPEHLPVLMENIFLSLKFTEEGIVGAQLTGYMVVLYPVVW